MQIYLSDILAVMNSVRPGTSSICQMTPPLNPHLPICISCGLRIIPCDKLMHPPLLVTCICLLCTVPLRLTVHLSVIFTVNIQGMLHRTFFLNRVPVAIYIFF